MEAEEFKKLKVRGVQEKAVVNTSQASIKDVYSQLEASPQGMVAIVSPDDKLEGVVTNTSFASGLMKGGNTTAEIMSTTPITINQEDNVGEAIMVMNEHKFDKLPVVDNNNKLVGIITRSSITRELNKHLKIKL